MKPITEQRRQELIALANVELTEWDLNSDHYSLIEIALNSLTSEPVGEVCGVIGAKYDVVRLEGQERIPDGIHELYTTPPVPVIKLPDEMMKQITGWFVNSSGENCATIEGRTWNNCIDEIKRLNGIK